MKLKNNYYLIRIVKENANYLFFLVLLVLIFFFFSQAVVRKFVRLEDKVRQTEEEVRSLKRKSQLVLYKEEIIREGIDLRETNQLLTRLIPNQEDYFSVIAALEEISLQSNFLIIGYTINLKASTENKLSLVIEGKGDQEAFFKFLKDYRYLGRRLITVDKIEYRTANFVQVKLNVNFYSGKKTLPVQVDNIRLSEEEKATINAIKNKISLQLKSESASGSAASYPTKSDPF